jgi:transposase
MERYTAEQVNRALAQEQLLVRWEQGEDFETLCQELGLSLSRPYFPQLRRRYRQGGSTWEALVDHRHGYPSKLDAERRAWVWQRKRENPALTQQEIAQQFAEQFHQSLSQGRISQILRVEGGARPGGPHPQPAGAEGLPMERAGVFFLQAAALQMGVLQAATQVVEEQRVRHAGPERALCHHRPETLLRRWAHLLWLPRFDLGRAYHLRWVRPVGLGVVAGGGPTLSYSTLEHFLGDLEAWRVAAPLGDALARCYLEVWPVSPAGAFFYVDTRRKVRYSGYPVAAGKISASDRVLGATTQVFLHDAAGHGLHMRSGPGDAHLTQLLSPLVEHFRGLVGRERVRGIVADQEMRSVALFLALAALEIGFVTLDRTPSVAQEADLAVEGLFVPGRRDPRSGAVTHWVAPARTQLRDRRQGLVFEAQVSLLVDVRAGWPGRLIPVLYHLPGQEVAVEQPVQVYVGRWGAQERVFRDMHACQNLDVHYGQKKVAVPNRRQERQQEVWRRQLRTHEARLTRAQRKVEEYTTRLQALEEAAGRKQEELRDQVTALRQASREAATPRERDRLWRQAERTKAQQSVWPVRFREKRRRLEAQQRAWQGQWEEHRGQRDQVAQALQELEERSFFDFDLEKDDLMTYVRMAGENAHRFVQERYFVGTRFEQADEATLVRIVYNQPGWVRREGAYQYVRLQGYAQADVQAAVALACQRVNQAQITLPSGHRLHLKVATKILDL